MIAKIGRGTNILGVLHYNNQKVDKENGKVLATHKMMETLNGKYTVAQLAFSFQTYLIANRKTEKPVLHISINPDPKDQLSDDDFKNLAAEYMKEMGYGDQPYVIFKHTDIERTHIHIVSVCVDEQGRKISDKFEKRHSMKVCRDLEAKYNLTPAIEKDANNKTLIFNPVSYTSGDIKSQIASVIRHLPKYYQFQTLGAYNALLSLFNITTEEVSGELHGQQKKGLVYFALNENGEKVSNPFKSSLFGKEAGLLQLQKHFEQSKQKMKEDPAKQILKNTIQMAMHSASIEAEFRKQLKDSGINIVIRRNAEGRIYGVTFIDHESRSVWNGSQLSKDLSANIFNDWWKDQANEKRQDVNSLVKPSFINKNSPENKKAETHELFDFLNKGDADFGLLEGLGGLLPEAQGDNFEELAFEQQMKKKKKRRF